jgi:phosphatidylinositol 4-kinase B
VLASVAVPLLPQWAGPLAIAQARKPSSLDDVISDSTQTQKISRSHTVTSSSSRPRRAKEGTRIASAPDPKNTGSLDRPRPARTSSLTRPKSSDSSRKTLTELKRPSNLSIKDANLSTASLPLPDSRSPKNLTRPPTPVSAGPPQPSTEQKQRRHAHAPRPLTPSALSREQKVKLLRQNYFRCETQFLTALENISNRLILVPKPARLSALRAELALIDQDLPAEVDIPVICPATLVGGIPSNSRHHRIVRLNPAECTVLNSAEKVPYLLMVEVLRDDFSFNPETADNETLVAKLLAEQGTSRRRIFDTSEAPRTAQTQSREVEEPADSVFEPSQGDLGSSPLLKALDDDEQSKENGKPPGPPPRLSSGATTLSTLPNLNTPRIAGASNSNSRSNSPGPLRKMTLPNYGRSTSTDQPDFSALATHMRTASQMLAQLESTSGKRPKAEVAAIRAKIIASMQSLEEQSFESDDTPTFDVIMANANAAAAQVDPEDIEEHTALDGSMNSAAGAARMENDQKTGGVQRKGDRDDPSAAMFGEAWNMKKDRIRKASPYGWMKNWDLVSVIVKTGADLRQEAFACQLIQVCEKIWQEAGTPVWVKRMRILVTGESSGLIETIANGVSLHSLKRSLTLATIASGQNPRGRIATLKDHFVNTFGAPETDAYKAAEDAFKRSLAAYSIISYILQLKDRHNGNVLIDNEGHIIHIDFGFMLSNSPGSVGFEAAPFKLTQDYVDVLGGVNSPGFDDYKMLCKQAFQGSSHSTQRRSQLTDQKLYEGPPITSSTLSV